MKKLFKNYTYDFDKNEAKVLRNFCNQALNQLRQDSRLYKEVKAFESVLEKLNDAPGEVKLSKDEVRRVSLQLGENLKHMKLKTEKGWFLKRWLFRSVFNQYNSLYLKLNE